ncbi:T9SS type A sorting domain-containing protein [candidate division KSB1 bacterium]|nr:T9SS type A sorting domain-containing protein [candidate division KSB1 bacterium]
MKKLTIYFNLCFLFLASLVFAQVFPPEYVKGPFPTGNETVRGDAPCDINVPDDMGTIHEYTAYRGTPVVDGDVENDPVWQSIPWTAMDSYNPGTGTCYIWDGACDEVEGFEGWDDISAWFKILWDDDHVYFAMKKHDNEYVSNDDHFENLGNIWQDDAYQIVLDANAPDDIGGPMPSSEIGLALLAFSETAYNSWRATNGDPLALADGNGSSAIEICDGTAFFGAQTEADDHYTEVMEVAFVKWDEILADEPQMMSIMCNDPDETHDVDALQWGWGIFSPKDANQYASIVYSSSEAPETGVETSPAIVQKFNLEPNYPNPFNPTTTISYSVNTVGNVELKVYDLLGHEIATLVNGVKRAGSHQVTFDARDLPSGIYIYSLKSAETVLSNKMILMK